MQRLTAAPRDHLTEAEVVDLLTGDQVTVDYGADLLNADLSFAEDISADLQAATVERRMLNRIHSTARLRLSRELQWGTALVRLWQSLSRRRGWKQVSETVDVGPLPYADVVSESAPVGWWRLGEASGTTAVDSSGNGHDGTYEGSPTLGVAGALVADDDMAMSLPGDRSRVNAGNPAALQIIGGQTIAMWLKPANFSLRRNPWNKAYGGEGTITQEPDATMNYYYGTAGGNASPYQGVNSGQALAVGEWQHIALVRDLTNMMLRWYVNGVQTNSVAASYAEAVASTNPQLIGDGYTNGYDGEIDEPAVYNRALTADEIKRHYEAGRARLRDYATVTRTVPDVLTARFNVGVYQPVTPEHPRGEDPVTYDVSAFDRLYLLDRQVGEDYTVPAGTTYRAALLQAFADAGLTGVDIDGSAADDTLPKDKTWPLVPEDTADPDQTSTPVTWLRVVNDLLRPINFRSVWAGPNGKFRCQAYQPPEQRGSEFTFDADDHHLTIVGEDRTIVEDMWATPNRWVFRQSNRPDSAPAPTEGDGIYTRVNQSDGPTSIDARDLVWTSVIDYEAASQAKLEALGDRRVAQDLRVTRRLQVTTGPFPAAGHADVFTYRDAEVGGEQRVQAVGWELDLTGAQDMRWDLERVT